MITVFNNNIRTFHPNNGANRYVMFALFNCSTYPEILVLSKTLFKSDNTVNINQDDCHHSVTEFRQSGGIFVCVKTYYMSEKCNDLSCVNDGTELCIVRNVAIVLLVYIDHLLEPLIILFMNSITYWIIKFNVVSNVSYWVI